MAIDPSKYAQAYGMNAGEAEMKKAAAQQKLKQLEAERAAEGKQKGSLIGTGVGAIIGAIAGNPMIGAQLGGQLGGVAGNLVGGGDLSAQDIMGAGQAVMGMPGLGELAGMEGAAEGSGASIGQAMKASDSMKQLDKLLKSGVIDKTKYDQLMMLLK